MQNKRDTSWGTVGKWYGKLTEGGGHYYHTHVVLPGVMRLLELKPDSSLVDIACGSGVLARQIDPQMEYLGIDTARSLVEVARTQDPSKNHHFVVADATLPYHFDRQYSHGAIILALQNMEHPEGALANAAAALDPNGRLVIVLNHPMFRIPRQSSWGTDEHNKLQFRRINRYLSPLEIPITAHPGQRSSQVTWSYHLPLSTYIEMLTKNGFVIDALEEWTSDKMSVGKASRQENRARDEFPLFMAIRARKAG